MARRHIIVRRGQTRGLSKIEGYGMISAIILAAGKSRRMGQPKMLLPWGKTTVLGQVIECLQHAEIRDILIITGNVQDEVEKVASIYGVRTTHNNMFES